MTGITGGTDSEGTGLMISNAVDEFGVIELDPIDPAALRSAEGSSIWETVRGKRNRITIGRPRWISPADGVPPTISTFLASQYPADRYALAVLELSLTLLPDHGCRFRTADLVLRLDADSDDGLFVNLEPAERTSTVPVTMHGPQGQVTAKVPAAGEIMVTSRHRQIEVSQVEASIEAFGTDSTEAGWRLSVTSAREIPLDTSGLRITLARPIGSAGQVLVTAVAEIDIRTSGDRWLTWAFKRGQPSTSIACPLPA